MPTQLHTFTTGETLTAALLNAEYANIYNNAAAKGANSDITSLSGLTTPLSVAQGGSGATTAGDALTNFGGTTTGKAVFTAADAATARATLGAAASGSVFRKNLLINGACEVRQRSSVGLSTSPQFGPVDRCTMWASSGAVTGGTVNVNAAATAGRTGNAAYIVSASLTGAGSLSWRTRMESADAKKLKNTAASFSIKVHQNTGGNVLYSITISKANAADDFTGVTTISSVADLTVATGTATTLKFENVSMGDCSNGVEIQVAAACGAITSKDFEFTEWQLEVGSVATEFEYRPFMLEQQLCRRYTRRWSSSTAFDSFFLGGYCRSTTEMRISLPMDPPMRVAPTLTTSTVSDFIVFYATTSTAVTGFSGVSNAGDRYTLIAATAAVLTAGQSGEVGHANNTNDAWIMLSAEL